LLKFQAFCIEHSYDYNTVREAMLMHCVAELNSEEASFATLEMVKPGLVLLLQLQTGQAAVFISRVGRWLD